MSLGWTQPNETQNPIQGQVQYANRLIFTLHMLIGISQKMYSTKGFHSESLFSFIVITLPMVRLLSLSNYGYFCDFLKKRLEKVLLIKCNFSRY